MIFQVLFSQKYIKIKSEMSSAVVVISNFLVKLCFLVSLSIFLVLIDTMMTVVLNDTCFIFSFSCA